MKDNYKMKITIDLYDLARSLCTKQPFTTKDLARLYNVDSRTAGRIIVKMISLGLIILHSGRGKNKKYKVTPHICYTVN